MNLCYFVSFYGDSQYQFTYIQNFFLHSPILISGHTIGDRILYKITHEAGDIEWVYSSVCRCLV